MTSVTVKKGGRGTRKGQKLIMNEGKSLNSIAMTPARRAGRLKGKN